MAEQYDSHVLTQFAAENMKRYGRTQMEFKLHFACPATVSDHDIAFILRDIARAVELGKIGKALDIHHFNTDEVIGQYELVRRA